MALKVVSSAWLTIQPVVVWNKQMASKQFNWWWHHTPTYASYSVENVHAPLLLATDGPTKNARTAILVLQSLTPNAQNVFRTLADFQMSNPDDQGTMLIPCILNVFGLFAVASF